MPLKRKIRQGIFCEVGLARWPACRAEAPGEGGPRRVAAAESFRATTLGTFHLVHAEAFRPLNADGAGPAGQPYPSLSSTQASAIFAP
jgi:hypothetical protein